MKIRTIIHSVNLFFVLLSRRNHFVFWNFYLTFKNYVLVFPRITYPLLRTAAGNFSRIPSIFSKISRGMLLLLTLTSWKHPPFSIQNIVPKLDSAFFEVIFLSDIVHKIVIILSFLITSLIFIPLRKTMVIFICD